MRTVQAVAWKEIQIYFSSPTAYIVAMIFLALASFFFVRGLSDPVPQASMSGFFQGATIIFALLTPTLTMRLLAEEQKLGTIELLLTSPVRDWEIVVGKYLASVVFLVSTVAPSLYFVLLLAIFANPDSGPIWSGYLGLALYGAASLSIGMLTSTLTNNQIVAAVVAMGILLVLYFTDFAAGTLTGLPATIVNEVGMKNHFNDFDRGVIDTKHIAYYLLVTSSFIFVTIRALESRRWR
ncbi:MAG: hypothetical protein CL702_08020 [Chloroflexi bacterium]|nr:hypothetical protein [Chloroflexota bacterium]|tara:strand:- start:41 stop:754 length:714 start_codon:yes stop_codon:yes gene_type:complete